VPSSLDTDPFVQIRLSDLLRLQTAANSNAAPPPVAATPSPAPPASGPEYLTTAEAAELLGVTVKGLEGMRTRGKGPPFIRVGGRVRYCVSDLLKPA